ncbi:MAG: AAA family ATPase [Cyanobacteriota bacterium]|nr:AAA family ATPase [Cyanobacteriota bacterium]
MAATLRASKEGLEMVNLARCKKGWTKYNPQWSQPEATDIIIPEATLKRFWRRVPIKRDTFVEICRRVGINDWEAIVDNTPTQKTASYIEFTVYNDTWVGREALIQQLSDRVNSSCRILLLVGITGIGKTALAERLVEELRGDWTERRENFENDTKATDFASVSLQWLEKWGETVSKEERKPEQLLRRLVKRLCNNRYLILMDSVEYLLTGDEEEGWGDFADEWWGKFFVSLLAEPSCLSRFILTSQDLPTQFQSACVPYAWRRCLLLTLLIAEC